MNTSLRIYSKLERVPGGRALFSKIICLKAPYFGTIHPRFVSLKPGYGEVRMKKRRSVQNHLGSVHALAMGNLCELVAGMTLDASIPGAMRWIPKSMNIEYLKIARTNLSASCGISGIDLSTPGDYPVVVRVTDTSGTEVVRATIIMHVSRKTDRRAAR
jgi:acyl-coenzyme A thioesterase PaaI-like protein